jgi:hypothetical protein
MHTCIAGDPLELLAEAERGGEADPPLPAVAQADRCHRLDDHAPAGVR